MFCINKVVCPKNLIFILQFCRRKCCCFPVSQLFELIIIMLIRCRHPLAMGISIEYTNNHEQNNKSKLYELKSGRIHTRAHMQSSSPFCCDVEASKTAVLRWDLVCVGLAADFLLDWRPPYSTEHDARMFSSACRLFLLLWWSAGFICSYVCIVCICDDAQLHSYTHTYTQ